MSRISQLTNLGKSEPPARHMRQNSQPSHLSHQGGGGPVNRDLAYSNMQNSIQNSRQNPNPDSFYQNLGSKLFSKQDSNQPQGLGIYEK
jgi:hypothetical protein